MAQKAILASQAEPAAAMDISDAFDEISNWEEQLLIEGEELGMEKGRELGVEEGRELGCVMGACVESAPTARQSLCASLCGERHQQ